MMPYLLENTVNRNSNKYV